MPSVLFVCTANQFRSPIAAACFLQQIGRENLANEWRVESAGTWGVSGLGAPAMALEAAAALGLGGLLDGHRSRQIDRELLEGFDLVLVMEGGHKEAICAEFPSVCRRVSLLSELVDGIPYDIPDPGNPGVDPAESGAILLDLIARGREKILARAQAQRRE
jgi:protein-tyrosine phosphatase